MSPIIEEMETHRSELSDSGSRASYNAEALEMEPHIQSSITISLKIVEICFKPKSKAPQTTIIFFKSLKPILPTFKKAKKGMFWKPVHDNNSTGNQMATPVESVGGMVLKAKDRNFWMWSRRKR